MSKIRRMLSAAAVVAAALGVGCASAPVPPPQRASVAAPSVAKAPEAQPNLDRCPDGDGDGVCDANDRCPTKIGPAGTLGCPVDPCSGSPLVVLVQFNYDSSEMPAGKVGVQSMDPVLDAVATAIAQDPACRVCIVGHASEEGTDEYNEELSRRRATAVQDYLTARHLSRTRMPTRGMGEQCQLVPESSRELNRRVDFRRLQQGQSCPMDCSG